MRFLTALTLCFALAAPAAVSAQSPAYPNLVTDTFKRLRNRDVDLSRPLTVKNKTIERGHMTVHFKDGVFFPHQIVEGQVFGGVFYGNGEITFELVDETNRELFQRRTKDETFGTRPFENAVLEFDDGTFGELFPNLVKPPEPVAPSEEGDEKSVAAAMAEYGRYTKLASTRGQVVYAEEATVAAFQSEEQKAAERMWKTRAAWMRDFIGHAADLSITQNIVEGKDGDVFAIEVDLAEPFKKNKNRSWVAYLLNVDWTGVGGNEEQLFMRHWPFPTDVEQQDWELLAAQDLPADYELDRRTRAYTDISQVDIEHYNLDIELYEDKAEARYGIKANVGVRFKAREDMNSVMLELISSTRKGEEGQYDPMRLSVRSLTSPAGKQMHFVHDGGRILVQLPETLSRGQTYEITFKYQGLVIASYRQPPVEGGIGTVMYGLLNTYPWFPQDDMSDRYTFDIKVTTPETIYAATSGSLVSFKQNKGKKLNIIEAKESVPSTLASIIMGKYQIRENDPDYDAGEVKIRVYTFPAYYKSAGEFLTESQDIIKFYESRFGPFPYQELDLAQMGFGFGFGQAPPGLVQLTGEAYLSKTELASRSSGININFRSAFLAHEIGHQWWGHRIGWKTYRDQWVSETMAEFSSALYVRNTFGEEAWNVHIREWKGYALNPKKTSGSWTGYFMGGSEWQATAYRRGPLIMYALYEALGEEEFIKIMRVWHAWIDNEMSATEDLRLVMESITGKDWSEFFETYIYSNTSIKDLVNDPVGVIDFANMPEAEDRSKLEQVQAEQGQQAVSEEPIATSDPEAARAAFDAFVASASGAKAGGWTLTGTTTRLLDNGEMDAVCQEGFSQSLGKNIFLCAANHEYKVGSRSKKVVECQAYVDAATNEVMMELPDGTKGAFCREN